jgi:hypothetical protein
LTSSLQINRSLFLSLTLALANGCARVSSQPASSEPPVTPSHAPVVLQPVTPTESGTASMLVSDDAGSVDAKGAGAEDLADQVDRLANEAASERGPCVIPPEVERVQREAKMFRMEEAPTPVIGPAVDCNKLREPPAPHCEDFPIVVTECFSVVSRLEPGPARAAMRCLLSKSGTRAMCKTDVLTTCVDRALPTPAPTPALTALCSAIVQVCAQQRPEERLTEDVCLRYLSSVRCFQLPDQASYLAGTCNVHACVAPDD